MLSSTSCSVACAFSLNCTHDVCLTTADKVHNRYHGYVYQDTMDRLRLPAPTVGEGVFVYSRKETFDVDGNIMSEWVEND